MGAVQALDAVVNEGENWDFQLDRCLMNAASALMDVSDPLDRAHGWMELADYWFERQHAELAFEDWREHQAESEGVDA